MFAGDTRHERYDHMFASVYSVTFMLRAFWHGSLVEETCKIFETSRV